MDIDHARTPVTAAARNTMRANRGRDTVPELALRSILHARGLRFRVNSPLPVDARRRADLTFSRAGLYVFVDGCFWHGCPEHFVEPKTRAAFWLDKIRGNQARDLDTRWKLEAIGAHVVRIWEHTDPMVAADAVEGMYRDLIAEAAIGHHTSGRQRAAESGPS